MAIPSAAPALGAALLFGASTPLAKLLAGDIPPLLLAGLLYLGSGLGLGALLLLRWLLNPAMAKQMRIARKELPWLMGAIVFGGILGPALLMGGLTQCLWPASRGSSRAVATRGAPPARTRLCVEW